MTTKDSTIQAQERVTNMTGSGSCNDTDEA